MLKVNDVVCLVKDVEIKKGVYLGSGAKGTIVKVMKDHVLVKFDADDCPILLRYCDILSDNFSQYMNPPQYQKPDCRFCDECLVTNCEKYLAGDFCTTIYDRTAEEVNHGKRTPNEAREKMGLEPVNDPPFFNFDQVNHPSHYNNNGYECIEVMEAIYGYEKVKIFCELNAFKYLWRAGHKDGEPEKKDIKKANWYTDRAKNILEKLEGDENEKL